MKTLTEYDWMDSIAYSPLQNLKSIPWACSKLFLITLLSSALGMIAVYFTESLLMYTLCLIGVTCFLSMLFIVLFGAEDTKKQEPTLTPNQQVHYDRKFAELKAKYDFERMVNE